MNNLNLNKTRDPVQGKSPFSCVHRRGHWPGSRCGKSGGNLFSVEHPGNTFSKLWCLLALIFQKGKERSSTRLLVEPFLYSPLYEFPVWSWASHMLALELKFFNSNKVVGLERKVISTGLPSSSVMLQLLFHQVLIHWRVTWAFKCEIYWFLNGILFPLRDL